MRTTLSLDEDVAADLRRIQAESGRTWKQSVNDVLRAGVAAVEREASQARRPARTRSVTLGTPFLGDVSNVHEVLSLAEGEHRR